MVPAILALLLPQPQEKSGKIKLDKDERKGVKSITSRELVKYVAHLASDEMEGREAGSDAGHRAGDFIAAEFERLGLKPGGESETYFQTFSLDAGEISRASLLESNFIEVHKKKVPRSKDDTRRFDYRKDFIPLEFSASRMVDPAPVAFVGYGISDEKEERYDDYKGRKVKGRVVMALDHVPMEFSPEAPFQGEEEHKAFGDPLRKARTAEEKGAVGLIIIKDIGNHPEETGVPEGLLEGWPPKNGVERVGIPVVYASQEMAAHLLGGLDPAKLQEKIDKKGKPASRNIAYRFVEMRVSSMGQAKGAGRNVIGVLEGADETLKKECLVIGAHYDHVGLGDFGSRRGAGQVHNGANDNASGTSAVMEVAEAFCENELKPRRTIIFIAFDGEEKGLLGSNHYVTDPLIPLEETVAMINMDMIGVNPQFAAKVGAGQENATLEEIHVAANRVIGLDLSYDGMDPYRGRSDQAPFLQAGVPALFFYTGSHAEYHTPADDVELINPRLIEGVSRLAFITALEVARRDERP